MCVRDAKQPGGQHEQELRAHMGVHFDPKDPATIADPFPVLRRLQDEDPVHWCPALAGWIVTRYEDCRLVLNDSRFSAARLQPFFDHLSPEQRAKVGEIEASVGLWAVFQDPPDHTRLRRLLNRGFTSRAIERMVPRIAEIVDDLLDQAAERGTMDFIADFAYPLPASVVMDMLGVPLGDLDHFKVWSDNLALFVGSAQITPDKYDKAEQATREMGAYFRDLVAERRRRPRLDLISELIAAEEAGNALSEDELVASAVLLLFAGHETTTNMLGTGLLHLIQNPEQLARLRADPEYAETAVEEVLRFDGPIYAMVRVTNDAVVLHERTIAKGDRIFAMLNAANRDPRVFDDPDRFDIMREPNRQMAFGYGIHFCLGAPLARLEGRIALPRVLDRLGQITIATNHLEWSDSLVLRGLKRLPIEFSQ